MAEIEKKEIPIIVARVIVAMDIAFWCILPDILKYGGISLNHSKKIKRTPGVGVAWWCWN